jgi:hypothetical protein
MHGKQRSSVLKTMVFSIALLVSGLSITQQTPAVSADTLKVASDAARIWFFRDYEPYGSRNFAPVELNGVSVGYVGPDGDALYRDVAPGSYQITVEISGTDVNQVTSVYLGAGHEVYVKILSAPMQKMSGDDERVSRSDQFYLVSSTVEEFNRFHVPGAGTYLVPPEIARFQSPR